MKIGDKVVCIDDWFAPEIRALYDAVPLEGITYVIRSMHEGDSLDDSKPAKCLVLLLMGVVNQGPGLPAALHPGAKERGFNSKRFRPLQELRDEATNKQGRIDFVPAERELVYK